MTVAQVAGGAGQHQDPAMKSAKRNSGIPDRWFDMRKLQHGLFPEGRLRRETGCTPCCQVSEDVETVEIIDDER